jgi:hypothetical protein
MMRFSGFKILLRHFMMCGRLTLLFCAWLTACRMGGAAHEVFSGSTVPMNQRHDMLSGGKARHSWARV